MSFQCFLLECHAGVTSGYLAQGNRLVGVALHGDPPEILHIGIGIHLPADLVDQRSFVEGRTFLGQGQRQAVVAKSQDIHSKLIFG